MLRRRESRAPAGRPVTHAAIYKLQAQVKQKGLSTTVTWKIFALYMSRNSMSINYHRSNLGKHKHIMNNWLTISYKHMHMPLYSFLYVVTKQTMYCPGIHVYHCVVVWPAPYEIWPEGLLCNNDPKVSCIWPEGLMWMTRRSPVYFCEYKSMMVTTPLLSPVWMYQHVKHLITSIHVKVLHSI